MGDKLRRMREARSWSQAHLADAARVNVRTVQRIEAGEPCSFETMLSLAAALGVDVSEFDPGMRRGIGPARLRPAMMIAALLCLAPGAIFLLVNVARSIGIGEFYDGLADLGSNLISFQSFNLVSPVVFVGGAAAAVLLCLPALVRLRLKVDQTAVAIRGVEFRWAPAALAIALLGTAIAGSLVVYAALETLRTPLS